MPNNYQKSVIRTKDWKMDLHNSVVYSIGKLGREHIRDPDVMEKLRSIEERFPDRFRMLPNPGVKSVKIDMPEVKEYHALVAYNYKESNSGWFLIGADPNAYTRVVGSVNLEIRNLEPYNLMWEDRILIGDIEKYEIVFDKSDSQPVDSRLKKTGPSGFSSFKNIVKKMDNLLTTGSTQSLHSK